MGSARRRLIIGLFLLLYMLASSPAGIAYAQDSPPLLLLRTESVYQVLEQGDGVRVRVVVELSNQNPQTRKKKRGKIYFYNRVGIPVAKGVQNIKAIRGDGKKLKVKRVHKSDEYDLLMVSLGRRLFYHQHMRFTLHYDIPATTEAPYYISANVARFPTYLAGDVGEVRAEIPLSYEVEIDNKACEIRARLKMQVVVCPQFNASDAYAFYVEAVQPTARDTLLSPPIPLAQTSLRLKVTYYQGEERWAQQVIAVLSQALPVLEEIMGFPYEGPAQLEIRQATAADTLGYEGLYEGADVVLIRPGTSLETIVHEGAHLWSQPFADRWLYEGWAEWSAREAMRRLQMEPEQSPTVFARAPVLDMALQNWTWRGPLLTSERAEAESNGYELATFVIDQLVKQVGLETLQEVSRSFLPGRNGYQEAATTSSYRKALEARGYDVGELWAKYVLRKPAGRRAYQAMK